MPLDTGLWNTLWTAVGAISGIISSLPIVGRAFVRVSNFFFPHHSIPSTDTEIMDLLQEIRDLCEEIAEDQAVARDCENIAINQRQVLIDQFEEALRILGSATNPGA